MPAQDLALRDHQEWINYLQPEGLVVSARALTDAQVILDNASLRQLQADFRAVVLEDRDDDEPLLRPELRAILRDFLKWPLELVERWNGEPAAPELVYVNEDLGVRLAPTLALRTKDPQEGEPTRLLLVQQLAPTEELDKETEVERSAWKTTPSRRFERLLRETKIPIGLIADAKSLRLIYAPPQENTGTLTFPLAAMTEIAGRKILGGFHQLLSRERLFTGPRDARLPALLEKSRKAQAAVSTALAEQVLASLYELVRGFQAADSRANGELLRDQLAHHPDHIYQGLLNVLLRLITLLYAEDRALLPQSDLFVRNYSLRGLFERLRTDAERYPDTMDHRYGAWHQLLVLFRLVEGGCTHAALSMPARRGSLFDPARFPFLEGGTLSEPHVPLVPDGTVHRVLRNLLIVDGERLSYRTLDVEHIGSVYETMMGFRMERAIGRGIALKATKKGGAPTTIDLEALLAEPAAKRAAWIKETAEQKIDGKALESLKGATSVEALVAALEKKIARHATPDVVAAGSMVLQPSDERRKSGSHYTPRSLTEPIVRKTLEPIFARLGPDATAEQVLSLSVCDPAMGSGAFLVESCRQLAARVKQAWERHRVVPTLPPDEDIDLYAMRLVAQRCLYGVDKNPVATDLAKLSLWLATLARDHAFTFLDHALKCGDSLVGLDREQLASFHWKAQKQLAFVSGAIGERVEEALALRDRIRNASEGDVVELRRLHAGAEAKTADLRLVADLAIAAFFSADSDKKREAARKELEESVRNWLATGVGADTLRAKVKLLRDDGVAPFHWWLEFPETFAHDRAGFDAIVGNPPFLGGTHISGVTSTRFLDWLICAWPEGGGRADLVSYFFRRAYELVRVQGSLGLVATNTIAQGDSRRAGLQCLCARGATIYAAQRRVRWSGAAAVIASIVHIAKGPSVTKCHLDGRPVQLISAFLLPTPNSDDPKPLRAMSGLASKGVELYGNGFLFDDTDEDASPTALLRQILASDPSAQRFASSYIGGAEVNDSPTQSSRRTAIQFGRLTEANARASCPLLMAIVEERVRPYRQSRAPEVARYPWWQYWRTRDEFQLRIDTLDYIFACSRVQSNWAVAMLPSTTICADSLVLFAFSRQAVFACLQSRLHETWVRCLASSMKDDLRYTPSDCFETFPFPLDFETNSALEAAGKAYYEFRAELMVRNNEGLTKTYNRFHDESETSPDIHKLRELHAAMDRAVLDAYPELRDIQPTCAFIADYTETDDDGREVPKSIRYRWPDEIRDEVLARLLALNQARYDEEVRLGLHSKPKSKGGKKKRGSAGDAALFDGSSDSAT